MLLTETFTALKQSMNHKYSTITYNIRCSWSVMDSRLTDK